MPASDHPQATSSDNIRVVHVQRGDGCPAFRRLPPNDCATFDPLKVVIPLLCPRVEEWDGRCTSGINSFVPICLVAVAHRACQEQIILVIRAALSLGDDVIYFKQRPNDVLRCQAVTAAKPRGFGNSLAESRRDVLHSWTLIPAVQTAAAQKHRSRVVSTVPPPAP